MTSFNFPKPNNVFILILFIFTLLFLSTVSSCKAKQVGCEAYSYNDSWQDEDWFDDDKLIQVNDTTFLVRLNDTLINVDSLITLYE